MSIANETKSHLSEAALIPTGNVANAANFVQPVGEAALIPTGNAANAANFVQPVGEASSCKCVKEVSGMRNVAWYTKGNSDDNR